MRRYLLDTNLLSAFLLKRPFAKTLIGPWIKNGEVVTSILVYGEVNEYLLARPKYLKFHSKLEKILKAIKPLYLTYPIMRKYSVLRRLLRPKRSLIGDIDTIIASTALERNLTLVTTDEDFKRVPDLKLMLIPRSKLKRQKH